MSTTARSAVTPGRAKPLGAYPHWKRIGDWIYVSGTSARQADNRVLGAETRADGSVHLDIAQQTRGVIENLGAVLRDAGVELSDLVDVTTFLVDIADFAAYNAVYGEYFGADGPTRTTVAVRALPHPQLLIEMKGVAHRPPGGSPCP